MAHHHQQQQHHYRSQFGDTTFTKVFVGGLAWETQTQEMRRYFEQFGDILEAVIITDKNTGRSKGYGFVTFRDAESANRACIDPNPMIDGRRANCNIASLGRPRPSPPRGRLHVAGGSPFHGTSGSLQVGAPLPPPPLPPPPPPPAAALFYPSYMYATYAPDYAYPRGVYNPYIQTPYYHHYHHHQHQQHQQQQQQQQQEGVYGGGAASSSTSSGVLGGLSGSPHYYYNYGYSSSWQTPPPRGPGTYSASQSHGIRGPSYLHYPMHGDSSFTPFSPVPSLLPSTSPTSPHHPLPPLSTSDNLQIPHESTTTTTGPAGAATSESPDS